MQRDGLIRLLDRNRDPAFTLTPSCEIWSWNVAAERLFGYPAAAAMKQSFATLLEPRGPLGKIADQEYCRLAVRQGSVASFDMRVKSRSGEEIWVSVSVLVLEALRASPALIVHLAHDITVAKRRETLIQELVERAQGFIEIAKDEAQFLPVTPISEQERRILQAFVTGNGAPAVARALGISPYTLRNHLHHINQKLGTCNRLEAVTHALRRKLI